MAIISSVGSNKIVHLCALLIILTAVLLNRLISLAEAENSGVEDGPLVIQTSNGPIQGLKLISLWTNKTIYSFHGIPYASPPVGNLRFKAPTPPKKWTSVKDCTTDQSTCMQHKAPWSNQNNTVNMSEDCLYLNVYTPQIKPGGGLLPVMVWIHGGAFLEGSGRYSNYGPDFLVGEGVVVVTLNYRLGSFGFMTLGTPDIPGNMGLKDQWFALKWVQSDIHHFGGDAGKVTLFGESAGSASVHLHYLSPLSKGLFHRVIGESGAGLGSWATRTNGKQYGLQLAEALNCSADNIDSVQQCLRQSDAQEIVNSQWKIAPTPEDKDRESSIVFTPCVDQNITEEPFLPDSPSQLIEKKEGSFVPIIMGINSEEGIMRLGNEEEIRNITNNLEHFIPFEVRNHSSESKVKQMVQKIKEFYFNDTGPSNSTAHTMGYINLYTDVMFGYTTALSARYYKDRANVYLYHFSFNGAFKEKIVEIIEKKFNISGVAHAQELNYIFVREKVNQTASENSNEMITWRRMVRMWTNFAKYGTPTVSIDSELQNITWSSVGKVLKYLHVDVNLTMIESDFLLPTVALWDSIYASTSSVMESSGLVVATTAILNMTN